MAYKLFREQARVNLVRATATRCLAVIVLLAMVPLIASAQDAKPLIGLGDPGTPTALVLQAGSTSIAEEGKPATLIGPDARLQLVVTAKHNSGQLRDRTRQVQYLCVPSGIVQVDSTGLVVPTADGKTKVTATFGNLSTSVEITVKQFSNPPPINFPNQIVPIFTKHSCNSGGCHGKSGGQNGFSLSLLGFEPAEDYVYLVHEGRGRRLFPASPDRSLLLKKASGTVPHGGGARFSSDSDEYRVIRRWVEQGMPYGNEDDPIVESISVYPSQSILPLEGKQQLKVFAHFTDGSTLDVTRTAKYTANNTEMVKTAPSGVVTMLGETGQAAVMIRYQGQATAYRATIPLGVPITKLPPERNFIDKAVFNNLKSLGLPPSALSNDSTFLRRVTVSIVGRLPTLEETQAFLGNTNANRRDQVIDRLLASNDYAYFFAQKWAAILRNKVEANSSRSGNYLFHDWVQRSLYNNKKYDQFVRELVAASGDVSRNPAVHWYTHLQQPNERVEDVAQIFLGVRIRCAKCHHHPFEKWSQHDYWGMTAFFTNVSSKPGLLRGEQRIFSRRQKAQARDPKTNEMVVPAGLGAEPFELTVDDDPRLKLANWMAQPDNPFFAKALVNRYWKHFFGRGIVDPEDDMRATNPPTNPELLDALAAHFIQSKFDLKDLIRTICQSTTYQLSEIPNEYNAKDKQSFSRFFPRRLNAEVLLDSIDDLMDTKTSFQGLPSGTRAVELPVHGINNFFLNTFGRPAGGSACECERTGSISMAQSLHLLNSPDIYNKLAGGRAQSLAADKDRSDEEKITELYYRAFSRAPDEDDLAAFIEHIAKFEENEKRKAYEDILWALINTKEFMYTH